MKEVVIQNFEKVFGKKPQLIVKAPGRVNLIGEHTDYNGGLVLPAAIDKYVWMAFSETTGKAITIQAIDLDQKVELNIDNLSTEIGWARFFTGILIKIKKDYNLPDGLNVSFTSNIPVGAGMSSSSAIECAFLYGINRLFELFLSNDELIQISKWSNHNILGIKGGIMDQFTSFNGREDQCILLDFYFNKAKYIKMNLAEYSFVLFDTKVKHEHATGEYNLRPKECKEALSIIRKGNKDIEYISQLRNKDLEEIEMPAILKKRVEFVIEENRRVLQFVDQIYSQDFIKMGKLLYESHEGLSKKYEVSCDELDFLVSQTQGNEYILGARMMGGGFGGCTLNLIKSEHRDEVIYQVKKQYKDKFQIEMESYPVKIVNGISIV